MPLTQVNQFQFEKIFAYMQRVYENDIFEKGVKGESLTEAEVIELYV